MKKLFVSLMLLLCVSLPCFATEPVTFYNSDKSIEYDIDPDSVNTLPNGNVVLNYVEEGGTDYNYYEKIYQITINENNQTYAVLRYKKYNRSHQVEDQYQNNVTATDFGPIPSAGPVHMVYDWLVNHP